MEIILLSLLVTGAGVVMLLRPEWVWMVTERWKSEDASQPSDLYLSSLRVGGAFCILAGITGVVLALVL